MRRRNIDISPAGGRAVVAGIELGPQSGPLDVLFLHANGFHALTYRHVFAELDPSIRLLAVDLRGHGRTSLPLPDPHPGWGIFADDLVALVAALGHTPRLLAGHSMGATTSVLAAPRLPDVARLMLFEPVIADVATRALSAGKPLDEFPIAQAALRRKPVFASREAAFEAYEGRGAFRTWPDAMLRDYVQDGLTPRDDGTLALACPPAWEAANFASFARVDPVASMLACEAGITIFRAAHGSTCFLDEAGMPAGAGRRIRLEVLPGTSHFLPMERPGIVCKAIGEVLRDR